MTAIRLFPILVIGLLGNSCFQQALEDRAVWTVGVTDDARQETKDPSFGHPYNFFQDGAVSHTNFFPVFKNTDRDFYLRGREIHRYLKNRESREEYLCLVQHFETNPGTMETLVLAARVLDFHDIKSNIQEYYLLVGSNRELVNKQFCEKSPLLDELKQNYQGVSFIYGLNGICSGCEEGEWISSFSAIFDEKGTLIKDIDLNALAWQIRVRPAFESTPSPTCEDSGDCLARDYDCCLEGRCVNDRTVKFGVDQEDPEFLEALETLVFYPERITNYPNFYNICPSNTNPAAPQEIATIDSIKNYGLRITRKKELYDCLNPVDGEVSFCTSSYDYEEGIDDSDGRVFYTSPDDLNFNDVYSGNTREFIPHGIHKITYGRETLFENNVFLKDHFSINGRTVSRLIKGNNSFNEFSEVKISNRYSLARGSTDKTVKIVYTTNGSCIQINSDIGKCKKIYVQGQNTGKATDHYPASNDFILPFYADTSRAIRVFVEGEPKIKGKHWQLVDGRNFSVNFTGDSLQVYDTQKVELSFYVNTRYYDIFGGEFGQARREVQEMCWCVGEECNLTPVADENGVIVDYGCVYPDPSQTRFLPRKIQLDSKTVPVRYFDHNGASHFEIDGETPPQEGAVFSYKNGDLNKPVNVDQYVGFNEIYGSIDSHNPTGPKPPKEVSVVRGRSYDVFVDRGQFSSCLFCGNDLWTPFLRLFPDSFAFKDGGGFTPDSFITNPVSSKQYRKDELLFGRACFVPVTMIPWTHKAHEDRQKQRLNRLNTQHFLFTNGYHRDWYGFDYGSVIGSWDGLVWFSIGNQRRVQAKSHHLFLAVNAYWGDLTAEGSFQITISEATPSIRRSGSNITDNFESDGAQCQKHHVCESDKDCVANLGWDYACESIVGLKTLWPEIDSYGLEIPDSEKLHSLRRLFNQTKGPMKRCVYRGKGAPCSIKRRDKGEDNFNHTLKPRHLLCSTNNHCRTFLNSNYKKNTNFNTKIARFGRNVIQQNDELDASLDTFGLHTRSIGRSMEWMGKEGIVNTALVNATYNRMHGLVYSRKVS